jgi:tetratricopeptide (TPR) repeat protein
MEVATYEQNTIKKHMEMLEAMQCEEETFFWRETGRSNLLTFLYLRQSELTKAEKQVDRCLQHSENNIASRIAKIRICQMRKHWSKVNGYVNSFSALLTNDKDRLTLEKEKLHAVGEVAYAYSFLGPAFYMDAISQYTDLFDCYIKLTEENPDVEDDYMKSTVCSWHFYLAQTYRRMLNKGNREKLFASGYHMPAVYDKICQHLRAVIDSDDELYKGKAMIELVDAFKTCETGCGITNIQFPYSDNPDQFMLRALEVASDDPYVLERCGRHYRQRATNVTELRQSIDIFDRLLNKCCSRHVAWHQKGLAYISLWHEIGKYSEAKLQTNKARRGRKRNPRNNGERLIQSVATNSSIATNVLHRETSGGRETHPTPLTAPASLPTLLPRNVSIPGKCPLQPKKRDYFDILRTNNPAVKPDCASEQYLKEAKKCFKQAVKLTYETHCRYLIDLARTLVSCNKYEKANNIFVKASQLSGAMDDNDCAYLYEQWGLVQHLESEKSPSVDVVTDVMPLYRTSVLAAVRGRMKSRVAVYKLRDILQEQLSKDETNVAMEMEYNVLFGTIEKCTQKENQNQLVQALKTNDDLLQLTWSMIDLLYARQHKCDAHTAFLYLTAIYQAGVLHLSDPKRMPSLLIEIARRITTDEIHQMFAIFQLLGRFFIGW